MWGFLDFGGVFGGRVAVGVTQEDDGRDKAGKISDRGRVVTLLSKAFVLRARRYGPLIAVTRSPAIERLVLWSVTRGCIQLHRQLSSPSEGGLSWTEVLRLAVGTQEILKSHTAL